MARAILDRRMMAGRLAALGIIGLLAACGGGPKKTDATAQAGPPVCTGDLSQAPANLQNAYSSLQRRTEAGPFYHALKQRLGPPRSCARSVQAGALRLAYEFPRNGALVVQIDPRIEFSEQRVKLRGLEENEAKSLLQAAEANAFGATGCGLNWEQPVNEGPGTLGGSSETVYRGDACNCQARMAYDGEKVIGLVLRSAC